MAGTTPNLGLNLPDYGDHNWDVPVNQNWTLIDGAVAEKANKDMSNLTSTGKEALVDLLYPVGSVYIGVTSTCPLEAIKGTWTIVGSGHVLWGADSNHTAGTTIAAGLPNVKGKFGAWESNTSHLVADDGPFKTINNVGGGEQNGNGRWITTEMDLSRANSIYGNSTTVQPPAYVVNIWQRTA